MYFSLTASSAQELVRGLGYKNVTLLVILYHKGKKQPSRYRIMSFSQVPAWGNMTWSVQCSSSCVPSAWRYCHCYLWHGRGSSPCCDKGQALGGIDKWLRLFFLRNNLWFSLLIWSEHKLLKALCGKAGEGCLHIISQSWKKRLTRCLLKA